MTRKICKIDRNQTEIVNILRTLGCSVAITSRVGQGFPDIVIGLRGKTYLAEIKDGLRIASQQKLTLAEHKFHTEWRGHICIINSIENAIKFYESINQ